jgi:hypothetical protein
MLTEKTKLLHNTEVPTQPWKTGLRADYYQYAPHGAVWLEALKRVARRMVSQDRTVSTNPIRIRVKNSFSSRCSESAWNSGASRPNFSARLCAGTISVRMRSPSSRNGRAHRTDEDLSVMRSPVFGARWVGHSDGPERNSRLLPRNIRLGKTQSYRWQHQLAALPRSREKIQKAHNVRPDAGFMAQSSTSCGKRHYRSEQFEMMLAVKLERLRAPILSGKMECIQ